jgi:hypothetical protein
MRSAGAQAVRVVGHGEQGEREDKAMSALLMSLRVRRTWLGVAAVVLAFVGVGVGGGVAFAVVPAPAWKLTSVAVPTVMPAGPGKEGSYLLVLENVGGAQSEGEVTLRDKLPAGVVLNGFPHGLGGEKGGSEGGEEFGCEGEGTSEFVCRFDSPLVSSGFATITVKVTASVSAGDVLKNTLSVSGGGAAPVSKETSTRAGVQGERGPAGISEFGFDATGPAGEPAQQAGGHPSLMTMTGLLNNMTEPIGLSIQPVEAVKDLVFYLPLGFLGDPQVAQRCLAAHITSNVEQGECPSSSRVGTILLMRSGVNADAADPTGVIPIYNVAPEKGYAAEFAYDISGILINLYVNVVRHDGTYMLRAETPGLPPVAYLSGFIASFYGDSQEHFTVIGREFSRDLGAFLTNPSACSSEPLDATMEMNTLEHPDTQITASTTAYAGIEGCDQLRLSSVLSARASSTQADEPSGYTVSIEAPQAPDGFSGLGSPPVKDLRFTLPAGTSLSPGAADGLGACQETGPQGIDIEGAESEGVGADGVSHPVAGHCPSSSQIASVRASSPLLGEELKGHLFLATPKCGGASQPACTPQDASDGDLFGLYAELEAPGAGVVVKLAGKALVDPVTGRVTTVFEGLPQFPVSSLAVETTGGPRAPLTNPQVCGTASSTSDLTPWSAPVTPDALSQDSFSVDWDGAGGACPASMPFSPGFSAGTVNPTAGAFSPFTLTLTRHDREQDLSSLTVTMPPGLLGVLKGVSLCQEPQAAQGTCSTESQIGTTQVASGAGADPLWITGRVYLTTGYEGQPFGLSIVVPAVAGPFDLGNVIVRAAISVDPHTAVLRITSDPLPQTIDGVPLRIQTVNVTIDRPGFTFNPTDCNPQQVTATLTAAQGASASVASPFTASGCKTLPFKPSFTVSTQAKTSKSSGASLDVKYTAGAGQANTAKVDVSLPKALPARLTTIQQACTEKAFAANPASCPTGSDIGTATATTPILANPVSGPVYLVSHGGAAFPDVVAILQGEGVTVELTGNINIKGQVTSAAFNTIPDAPISVFQMLLPEGPHSGLAANLPPKAKGNMCGQTLTMPTTLTAQNGAVIKQTTKVTVSGCPKAKKKTKTKSKKPRKRARK